MANVVLKWLGNKLFNGTKMICSIKGNNVKIDKTNLGDLIDVNTEELEEDVERALLGNHVYSTTERVCGEWIDGSNIYEKTIVLDTPIEIKNNAYTKINTILPNIKIGINFMAYDTTTGENSGCKYYDDGLKTEAESTILADVIVAQYTKYEGE